MAKPALLITRRVPPDVEARAVRDYDARLNPDDLPRSGADLVRLAQGAAAILCCPAEQLDAGTIAALPDSVRVIATFSVGYDHAAVGAPEGPLILAEAQATALRCQAFCDFAQVFGRFLKSPAVPYPPFASALGHCHAHHRLVHVQS